MGRNKSLEINREDTNTSKYGNAPYHRATIGFDSSNFLNNVSLLLLEKPERIESKKTLKELKSLTLFSTNKSKNMRSNITKISKKLQNLSKYSHLFGDIEEPLNSARKTTYEDNMTEMSLSKNPNSTDFSIYNDKVTYKHSYNNSILLKNKREELSKNKEHRYKMSSHSVMTDF